MNKKIQDTRNCVYINKVLSDISYIASLIYNIMKSFNCSGDLFYQLFFIKTSIPWSIDINVSCKDSSTSVIRFEF